MFNIFSGNFKECSKSICDYLKFSKLQKKKSTLIYIEYFFRVLQVLGNKTDINSYMQNVLHIIIKHLIQYLSHKT